MFDFETTHRRHAPEPDLVPILDGLVAVIFFLLLSITFIGMTKLTLPPSAVAASASSGVPVSGRVLASLQGNLITLKLEWLGNTPGAITETIMRTPASARNNSLIEAAEKISLEFKAKFPEEKSLQLALSSNMNYQELISVMDGLRKNHEDLALSSYTEAD